MIIKKKIQKPAEVIEEKPAVIESEKQVDEDKIDLFNLDNIDFKQRQERRRGDRRFQRLKMQLQLFFLLSKKCLSI